MTDLLVCWPLLCDFGFKVSKKCFYEQKIFFWLKFNIILENSQNDQKAGRTGKLKRPESRNVGKPERPESRNDRKSRNTEMIPVFWRTDAPCANRRSRWNNNLLIIFPGFFSCSVRPYYWHWMVWCTNSIGVLEGRQTCLLRLAFWHRNRLIIGLTKRKRIYNAEKTTENFCKKQT
jgi:hypothetical protein